MPLREQTTGRSTPKDDGQRAERVYLHSEGVEQREQQVRHLRVLLEHEMPSPLQTPGRATRKDDGQRADVVMVAVAERAAIEHHRVIEQRAVAIGCLLQALDEI